MTRLLAVLVFASTLFGQTNTLTTMGSVSGRVLDSDTRRPISGIRVISSQNRDNSVSVTTDREGRYVFPTLLPGKHSIDVYDGSLAGISMTATQVATVIAGRATQVDFHTRHLSQVSGRVLDEDGNPMSGIQVSAIKKEYLGYAGTDLRRWTAGDAQITASGTAATTDDQGRYLLRNLAAGRQYWIAARIPRTYTKPVSDAPVGPDARKRILTPTFYPNANSIDTATAVVPHSQELLNDVDIRMLKTNAYCLEATLTDSGAPATMSFLLVEKSISNTNVPANLPGSQMTGPDGRIRLCDLYPGEFQLVAARLSTGSLDSLGSIDFTITNKDVRDIRVAAIPRSTVSSELVWDKQSIEPSSQPLQVRTYPATVTQSSARGMGIPGTITLDVVPGFSYVLAFPGLDARFYVKDVSYGGSKILHQPFVPRAGDAKLRITIGTDAGSLTATVLTNNGQPSAATAVIVVPAASQTDSEVAATFRAGVTDENGSFTQSGLPPGKYDVFAAIDPGPNRIGRAQMMLIDPTPEAMARIRRTRAHGKNVEVTSSGMTSVSLSPILMD